jgi:hypothetical protein
MRISEVYEFGSFDLRVSPRGARPGFAPSVPAMTGTLPEFNYEIILKR